MLVGWLVASLVLLVVVALAHVRLGVARRRWGRACVDGVRVYVSRDVGPAALGFFGGAIVVPEWALALEARLRRLMLLHEREHVRAGDPRLLWLGLAAAVAMPWNPLVWWQLRRLRLAIEVDCDARVLRRAPDARAYGTLLLEVGRHHCGGRLLAAALAEPRSFLERRIRMLLRPRAAGGAIRPVALAAVAAGLTVLACEAPEPTAIPVEAPGEPGATAAVVEEAVDRASASGSGCAPLVVVDGSVHGAWSPGDAPATVVASLAPAEIERIEVVKGRAAAAAVEDPRAACGVIRITSRRGARLAEAARRVRIPGDAPIESPASGDGYTAFSPEMERPSLRNAKEVSRALERHYPPLLRDAGIGGTVMMLFRIDRAGGIAGYEIGQSSGRAELDAAAAKVAALMDFEPARMAGEPLAVVVQIPITFRVEAPTPRPAEPGVEPTFASGNGVVLRTPAMQFEADAIEFRNDA